MNVGSLPAVQAVAGAVQVANLPAVQAVAGTVAVGNLPLDGGGNIRTVLGMLAELLGTVGAILVILIIWRVLGRITGSPATEHPPGFRPLLARPLLLGLVWEAYLVLMTVGRWLITDPGRTTGLDVFRYLIVRTGFTFAAIGVILVGQRLVRSLVTSYQQSVPGKAEAPEVKRET